MEEIQHALALYKKKWDLLLKDVALTDIHEEMDDNVFYLSRDKDIRRNARFMVGFINLSETRPLKIEWKIGEEVFSIHLIAGEFRLALGSEPLWLDGCASDEIRIVEHTHDDFGVVYFHDKIQLPLAFTYRVRCEHGEFAYDKSRFRRVEEGPHGTTFSLQLWTP